MKRSLALVALLLPLGAFSCRPGPAVVVDASIAVEGTGERRALAELPVRLLPYDRDAIFDSLEAAYAEPEPTVPEDLLQQQRQLQQLQTEWNVAQERWNEVRDSLRQLSAQTQRMEQAGQRGTPQYQQLFRQFEQLADQERAQRQRSDAAFQQFDQVQRQFLSRADSIRIVREAWAERAFADFDRVVTQRMRDMRREEHADTTNENGIARIRGPRDGRWWVYARYTLPFEELYWNVPIEVVGDSVHVPLTRENAQPRPVF